MAGITITPQSIIIFILLILTLTMCFILASSDDWYKSSSIHEKLTNINNYEFLGNSELSSVMPTISQENNMTRDKLSTNILHNSESIMSSDMLSTNMSTNTSTNMLTNASSENYHEICEINDSVKCSSKTCGMNKLYPILDPRFNMRESSKQCLLLEDHLNNKQKRCTDCIRKHFLIIDGLLEEAVSLEKDNNKRDYYRDLYVAWINIEKQYAKTPHDPSTMDNVSKLIRTFRKPLVEEYFDIVSEYET